MSEIRKLKIIECKYCYNVWQVQMKDGVPVFSSSLKEFSQRRDVELYHLCGLYHTAGVPFEIHQIDYGNYHTCEPYVGITRSFSDAVFKGIKENKAVLVAGGYCNYAPAIAGGLQRAIGEDKEIGLIWIDAHSDNQIVEDFNEPIRLVGVPISSIVGQTLPQYRQKVCGLNRPLKGHNIIISDARITLDDEETNMKSANIVRLNRNDFDNPNIWKTAVNDLADRVDVIYLSVDVDILKPQYLPAYETFEPGGHDIETVMNNISTVMDTGKVCVFSMFCVDFDHYERGGEYTYLNGMKLIASGLQSWKRTPF